MHKITSKPFTDMSLFSWDENSKDEALLIERNDPIEGKIKVDVDTVFKNLLFDIEAIRQKYLETKDKRYWRALIQILPCGWMQKRTLTLNYQVLREMYHWRKNHKLSEWRYFCEVIETLPYAKELICYEKKKKGEEN